MLTFSEHLSHAKGGGEAQGWKAYSSTQPVKKQRPRFPRQYTQRIKLIEIINRYKAIHPAISPPLKEFIDPNKEDYRPLMQYKVSEHPA